MWKELSFIFVIEVVFLFGGLSWMVRWLGS
jgi:hypothetical protein